MARSVELESAPRRRRRREDSEQEILEAAERAAAVEALYTIWTRTLYGAGPED